MSLPVSVSAFVPANKTYGRVAFLVACLHRLYPCPFPRLYEMARVETLTDVRMGILRLPKVFSLEGMRLRTTIG